jgi:hypothetical protein
MIPHWSAIFHIYLPAIQCPASILVAATIHPRSKQWVMEEALMGHFSLT